MDTRPETDATGSSDPGTADGLRGGSPPAPTSLRRRALHGSFWTVLRFGAEYGLRLASSLILTRLLVPEAFGLMALVSSVMTGLQMFSDMGIGSGVIRHRRGDDPDFLNTAWTLQAIRGGVLWGFAALFADALALVYAKPELRAIVVAAGFSVVLSGFQSIALVKLRRDLEVRRLALIEVTGQLLTGVATVCWALAAPSVWALVWGGLLGGGARLVISHLAVPEHRCRFRLEVEARKELFGFGKWIFVSTILFFLAGQADRLIFGRLLSLPTLGLYSIAATLAAIPTQIVWQIGHMVVFPALSQHRDASGALGRIYRRSVLPLLLLGLLPVALVLVGGRDLIGLLYDPRYAEAGWMLQILAIGAWFQVPQAASGAAVLAFGQPRWLVIGNGAKFAGLLVFLPLGYHLVGAAGAIAGLVAAELLRYLALAIAVRRSGLPGLAIELGMTGLLLALAGTGWAVQRAIAGVGGGELARLAGLTLAIVVLWLPAALWILRDEWSEVLRGWRARRAGGAIAGSLP